MSRAFLGRDSWDGMRGERIMREDGIHPWVLGISFGNNRPCCMLPYKGLELCSLEYRAFGPHL